MAGIELANGFSELTDSVLLRSRFEEEYLKMKDCPEKTHKIPELFLQELETIDSAAGIALGLDRLFMLLSGQNNLDAVVTFSPDDLDI